MPFTADLKGWASIIEKVKIVIYMLLILSQCFELFWILYKSIYYL